MASHQIQTLKFELDIPSVSNNRDIQNKIVNVFNGQFTSMLNEVFNEYQGEEDIVLESVSLQLDPILFDQLENKIIEQSREKLIEILESHKSIISQDQNVLNLESSATSNSLHPLLYYLMHGVYAWNTLPFNSFSRSWTNALKHSEFKSQFRSVTWHKNAIKRLVNHLNKPLFERTIQKIFPSFSAIVLVFNNQLINAFQKFDHFNKSSQYSEETAIRELTLVYLITHQNSTFNEIDFLHFHFHEMSMRCNVELIDLLNDMVVRLKHDKKSNIRTLKFQKVIEKLKSTIPIQVDAESNDLTNMSIEKIEEWLLITDRSEDKLLVLREWVLTSNNRKDIQGSWVEHLKETLLENVISILSPKSAQFVFYYHKAVFKQPRPKLVTNSKDALKRAVWTFTLDYFLSSFSSSFHAKEYVSYHTKKLSNHYSLNASTIIKEILMSISSIADPNIEHNRLLNILKSITQDNDQPSKEITRNDLGQIDPDVSLSIKLIEQRQRLSYQQVKTLRQWLLHKSNFSKIQEKWIHTNSDYILKEFIKYILPQSAFVINSIKIIDGIFESHLKDKSKTLDLRKKLYEHIFIFIQSHPHHFKKETYLKFQFELVLKHYKISYKELLKIYSKFLIGNTDSKIDAIDFFGTLNDLQISIEKKYGRLKDHRTTKLKINELGDYFSTTNRDFKNRYLLRPLSFNRLQSLFEILTFESPQSWFAYLNSQSKTFHFHSSFSPKIKTSLLRRVYEFNAQYEKWAAIQKRYSSESPTETVLFATIFFLEEGTYPIWMLQKNDNGIKKVLLSEAFISILDTYKWTDRSLDHWTLNLSHNTKYNFLKKYLKGANNQPLLIIHDNLIKIYEALPNHIKPQTLYSFEKSFWTLLFERIQTDHLILSNHFMTGFFKQWADDFGISFHQNELVKSLIKPNRYLPKTDYKKLFKREMKTSTEVKAFNKNRSQNHQKDETIPLSLSSDYENMDDQLVKWHLDNCGLILVHPFLGHLFKILEYVDANNKFKTEDLQQRAIQLMYFIATGETKFGNEAELAMCKVICGSTIQQAIPQNIILNDEEMNTAQEMMHAVIERWEKIGNTSIEGLRQTFLQRNGLLEEKDNAYQLSIETSGVDVLLDFIPWNIDIVQLPWMNTIIYISWR